MTTPLPISKPVPWYAGERVRKIAAWVLLVAFLAEAVCTIFFRDGDFECHRVMGQDFLAGDPYARLHMIVYPPGRTMMNALLALGPYRLVRAVSYALTLLALWACYRWWDRLAGTRALAAGGGRAAAVLAGLLLFGYLLRDLDECGMQIFLLLFLTAGACALAARRPGWCGFWLATAATYKVTPVLFLPFLLWKRQWRAAGWMAVWVAAWVFAPALGIGLEKTLHYQDEWAAHLVRVARDHQAYPTQLLEPQKLFNLSLQAGVARFLETYPPGHPLYVDHPLFAQPGSFAPETAYYLTRGILLVFGLALAWRLRRPWDEARRPGQRAGEWAVMCILCAVLSPVCWKQHMVLALPAAFLVLRALPAHAPVPRWRMAALLAVAAVANLTRDAIAGKGLGSVFLSYKLDTWAIMAVLGLVLTLPAAPEAGAEVVAPAGDSLQAA